ncbi:MAG: glycosyltransferase family 2 protein [Promethearchaeota archaeon]
MSTVTAVIPAYNEANRIVQTLNQVKPFVDEIIVVDDASTDSTGDLARNSGANVLTQPKNKGYINAIKYGFKEASGEIVITLDADGEFSAQEVPDLLKPLIDGYADMVQGHRNIIPRPSERVLTWLAQKKAPVGDSGTGLRAIRTHLARSLEIKGACICGVFSLEVVSKGGRIVEIPITLQKINKPRKIAWFHFRQFFYLLPWLFIKFDKKANKAN